MDYEKKQRLIALRDSMKSYGYIDGVEELDSIFPDLVVDEDEKIRKEISTLYADIDACITELLKARIDKDSEAEGKALFKMEGLMVATLQVITCIEDYLEKQKEPKSLNISAASEWLRKHVHLYMNSEYNEFHKCVEYDGSIDKERLINDFEEAMQKEQQSAEWSEEDAKNLKRAINICVSDFGEDCETAKFLKSLPERFNLQPKQEWSEEDEAKKERLISIIKRALQGNKYPLLNNDGATELIDWLKFLRPQYHGDVTMTEAYKMGLETGKASSWKPSEEQMAHLKRCFSHGHTVGLPNQHVLESLYNDLKKLTKE